jgi:chromosome segregation ATPase
MSKSIRVKKYDSSGGFWGNGAYVDYDLDVTVPSDLDTKADRSSVDAKIKNVETKISTESSNRENLKQNIDKRLISFENALTSKIDKNLLDKMKSEILSNDRLTKEQNTLQSLFQLLIDRMHKECSVEYEKIKREINTFKSIDLNKELQVKLAPLDQILKTLAAKIETTFEALKKVKPLKDTLAANADFQNKLASAKAEINTLISKYAEERRNIQLIYEDNKKLKSEISKLENEIYHIKMRLDTLDERTETDTWDVIGWIFVIIFSALGGVSFLIKLFGW